MKVLERNKKISKDENTIGSTSHANNNFAVGIVRADDDLTTALIDSWAIVADIITFYQERIANEGFLRTARERRSLIEIGRMTGYELRPGVAASTFLAFDLEEAQGTAEKTIIDAGAARLRAFQVPVRTPRYLRRLKK